MKIHKSDGKNSYPKPVCLEKNWVSLSSESKNVTCKKCHAIEDDKKK